MGIDLLVATAIFLASAVSVIFFGIRLATYGDALSFLTGWGRLFVGSMLLAGATSLPEVSTNIAAVRLIPPNPELAMGNVLGANMINMFTFAVVALLFGGKRFLQRVAPQQAYLILLAALLAGLVLIFAALRPGVSLGGVGLSSAALLVVFVVGMRIVYGTRPRERVTAGRVPAMTLKRAWTMFSLVSAGVVIAGFFLAYSADQIAQLTGVASSTLGILALSLVTTIPEASAAIAAARIGAADLGVGNLFGSCCFNVTILFFADIFYRQGIVLNQSDPAHLVAGGIAIGLILLGLTIIMSRERLQGVVAVTGLIVMAFIYIIGAVVVATLGTPEAPRDASAIVREHALQPPEP